MTEPTWVVTGGSGFIGTHLVGSLLRSGRTVVNLDRRPPKVADQADVWQACDLLDEEATAKAVADLPEYVLVHLAARTDTNSDRVEDYQDNHVATERLLNAVRGTAVLHSVITSTQYVIRPGSTVVDLEAYDPHTAYGESKVLVEKLVRAGAAGDAWTIVRPVNVWGPWHPAFPHELWRYLAKGQYRHPRQGPVERAYGWVGTVVEQIQAIVANRQETAGRTLYLGDPPLLMKDWVNEFSLGLRGEPVREVPKQLFIVAGKAGDVLTKAGIRAPMTSRRWKSMSTSDVVPLEATYELLGRPSADWRAAVRETVEWLRQEGHA